MSDVRILRSGDREALEAFLGPHADASVFLLSNSRRAGLDDHGQPFEGTYFAAFGGGRIVGVAAHYWVENVILQAPPEVVEALVGAVLEAAVRPVAAFLGPDDQVGRALEVLGVDDAELQVDEREGLYSLPLDELVVPEILASGRVRGRRIERRDVELTAVWRMAYYVDLLKTEDTPELREQCREEIKRSCEMGHTWVLEESGEPVASTSFNAEIAEVVQVGGVWTPPELRGRGYGRAVVAASLLDARDEAEVEGRRSILFTGRDNVSAIRAYLALGVPVDRRLSDRLPAGEAVKILLETPRLVLREMTLDDLDDLCELDGDPEVMRFIDGGRTRTREQIRPRLERILDGYREHPGRGFFAAVDKASGRFLGWFHLRPYRHAPEMLELGYRLRRDVWGRGLATEGSKALVAYGFETFGVPRIVADTVPENRASMRVMEKVGLAFEGQRTEASGLEMVRYGATSFSPDQGHHP